MFLGGSPVPGSPVGSADAGLPVPAPAVQPAVVPAVDVATEAVDRSNPAAAVATPSTPALTASITAQRLSSAVDNAVFQSWCFMTHPGGKVGEFAHCSLFELPGRFGSEIALSDLRPLPALLLLEVKSFIRPYGISLFSPGSLQQLSQELTTNKNSPFGWESAAFAQAYGDMSDLLQHTSGNNLLNPDQLNTLQAAAEEVMKKAPEELRGSFLAELSGDKEGRFKEFLKTNDETSLTALNTALIPFENASPRELYRLALAKAFAQALSANVWRDIANNYLNGEKGKAMSLLIAGEAEVHRVLTEELHFPTDKQVEDVTKKFMKDGLTLKKKDGDLKEGEERTVTLKRVKEEYIKVLKTLFPQASIEQMWNDADGSKDITARVNALDKMLASNPLLLKRGRGAPEEKKAQIAQMKSLFQKQGLAGFLFTFAPGKLREQVQSALSRAINEQERAEILRKTVEPLAIEVFPQHLPQMIAYFKKLIAEDMKFGEGEALSTADDYFIQAAKINRALAALSPIMQQTNVKDGIKTNVSLRKLSLVMSLKARPVYTSDFDPTTRKAEPDPQGGEAAKPDKSSKKAGAKPRAASKTVGKGEAKGWKKTSFDGF